MKQSPLKEEKSSLTEVSLERGCPDMLSFSGCWRWGVVGWG